MEVIARFSFAITALVTIAGWFVVAGQADRREFRKEVRDRMRDLASACAAVQDSLVLYWMDSDGAAEAGAAIELKAEIKRLSRHSVALREAGLEFDQPHLVSSIRKLATGGNFDAKGRLKSDEDADRVADTVGAIEDLLVAVDGAFYQRFRSRDLILSWRILFVILLAILAL